METAIVLVVESEAIIRLSTLHMLQDAGFAGLEASNADEAIAILEAHDDIRAVITDIDMSGTMNGLRLAHAIRDRWPPIHLLVASGRTVPAHDEMPANGRFIHKPYSAEDVIAALRELLGASPGPHRFPTDTNQNCDKVAHR